MTVLAPARVLLSGVVANCGAQNKPGTVAMALAFLRLRQVLYDRELWRRLSSLEGPPAAHAVDSPASVFPMETEATDQSRLEDRHGATWEQGESERQAVMP